MTCVSTSAVCGLISMFSFLAVGDELRIADGRRRTPPRSAATRSAGTPGVVASGRPTVDEFAMKCSSGLSSARTG